MGSSDGQGVAPAGWFQDPERRHQYRFWDGSAWTDYVSDDGQQSLAPLAALPAASTDGAAAREHAVDEPGRTGDPSGRSKSRAQSWAEGLAQAEDWQGLADLAGRYTWELSEADQERQESARRALLAAGERAVDAVGETLVQRKDLSAWNLAWILLASQDRRAAVPLVSRLADLTPAVTDVERVVEFIATTHAVEAVPGLEALLDHEQGSARRTAAHILGLLGVSASTEALLKAAEYHPSDVRGGLEDANTQFSRSVFASMEDKRKATGPDTEAMSEANMLQVLHRFLSAYLADDLATYRGLELTVRDIGVELDRRGGEAEMRRILEHFSDPSSAQHLARCWNGIGSWWG